MNYRTRRTRFQGEALESKQMLHGGGFEGRGPGGGGLGGLDNLVFGSAAAIEDRVTQIFDRYDANDDGVLNADDNLPGRVTRLYGAADADGDEGISTAELTTFLGSSAVSRILGLGDQGTGRGCGGIVSDAQIASRVERALEIVDADGEGDIDSTEVTSAVWEQMTTADANADSSVSSDELTTYLESLRDAKIATLVTNYVDRVMEQYDADNDSAISQSEVSATRWNRISVADTNNDASISEDELTTYVTDLITSRLSGESSQSTGSTSSATVASLNRLSIRRR